MHTIKFLALSSFIYLFVACGSEKKTLAFEILTEGDVFHQNDNIAVSIKNPDKAQITNVVYSIDGKQLNIENGKITLDVEKLGNKTLTAKIGFDQTEAEIAKNIKILSAIEPAIYGYEIVNVYPHDNKAYTQGLEFHQDTLYEGTGKKGRSFLRKVDFTTGKPFAQIDLDPTIFGEGITILNNKIYQLSWQSGMGFIYDLKSFKKIDSFQYGQSKEGWGLANDDEKLYKSDGTERIWFLDPETLAESGYIETVTNKSVFNKANELEYVAGKLYANVYQKPSVMIIDAKTGTIEGVVNFSGLSDQVTKTPQWSDTDNVLNGIAYHPTRKTFFVTGKDWDKMFEVNILKK